MKNTTVIFLCLGLATACVLAMLIPKRTGTKVHGGKTIAILQTTSHPALDAVTQGFKEEIQRTMPTASIESYNGQGSIDQLHMIAKKIANNKNIDAILAVATPAAQAIAHLETTKPIIIAAVTDPQAAGLLQDNVCGCTDMLDCTKHLALMKTLVPSINVMGIIYNTGEINSTILVKQMKHVCTDQGITCIDLGIAHEVEILAMLEQRLPHCDLLWALTDNTVASAMSLIAHKAVQLHKPYYVSFDVLHEKEVLACAGINYKQSGKQAAEYACKIVLEGKKASELPLVKADIDVMYVNEQVAKKLGIIIEPSAASRITWIHKESL